MSHFTNDPDPLGHTGDDHSDDGVTVEQILNCADAYGDARIMASKGRIDRSEVDAARKELRALVERALGVPEVYEDWMIDRSTGRPILTYKGCSVIEAEQAEYVMRLVNAAGVKGLDAQTFAPQPPMKDPS